MACDPHHSEDPFADRQAYEASLRSLQKRVGALQFQLDSLKRRAIGHIEIRGDQLIGIGLDGSETNFGTLP